MRGYTYSLEGVGHWNLAKSGPLVGGVEGFHIQDGGRNRQVGLVCDEGCSTGVGADTHVLEHLG